MKIAPQTIVGIETAGEDLRIAVLRAFGGKQRLIRLEALTGFAPLSDEDKATALAAYFKKNRLAAFNVYLTLPGTSGVTRDLEFPASVGTGDTLRSAVSLQIENLSPWPLDEIYWDCTWETPAKSARSIVVHVAIIPRAVLDPWIGLFRSSRLALTGASLSSLSWAHGATVLWGSERPAMIVGAEKTYVESTLIRDGRVYAAQMPGDDSTQLVTATASQLMRSGRIDSADQLRLIGHGANIGVAGLDPVRLPIQGAGDTATGFGAISTALLGLVRSGFRLNLVPAPLRYQRNYMQLVPTYALATLLVLLGLAAWLREPYQQTLYAQQLDQEGRRLAVDVKSVADQENQLNRISERLKTLDGLTRGRDANLEALRELSRVLPTNTWLVTFAVQDNVMQIAGFSESAAAIQKLLEDSPIFRDVQFTTSIVRDAVGKDRFNLRASIEVRP
jgi:Tfp pilus assembly protein PilN